MEKLTTETVLHALRHMATDNAYADVAIQAAIQHITELERQLADANQRAADMKGQK